MTDKHTPCNCRATERIPSPEELQDHKEFFERTGEVSEPKIDIEFCPLHAAAPKMLEALEAFLNSDPSVSHMKVTYENARLAVTHAKGDA